MVTWDFLDPETDEVKPTTVQIPGPAYDTITDELLNVLTVDPHDSAYLLVHDPRVPHIPRRRSKCHIRSYTNADGPAKQTSNDTSETSQWLPCRNYKPLPATVSARVPAGITDAGYCLEDLPSGYYAFVERVAKVYQAKNVDTLIHDRREALCADAVEVCT